MAHWYTANTHFGNAGIWALAAREKTNQWQPGD